ncbi:MAG: DNA adenine methylase [Phycisphaerales bacterium JB060]
MPPSQTAWLKQVRDGSYAARPFVKWAGGKRRLIPEVVGRAPAAFHRYVEPFLGGGAVALALGWKEMVLNDANGELIEAFRVVRDALDELVPILDVHRARHSKSHFYEVRATDASTLAPAERAARFIYLNKTCFNGLYRVNRHGQFNVPFGRAKNPSIYDSESLKAAASALSGAELMSMDFEDFIAGHIQTGDFVYLDPPYIPVGQYSDFKRYTKEQFREREQERLAVIYGQLVDLGAYPILSNSYTELTMDLYSRFRIEVVEMSRSINKVGTRRGAVKEVLVLPGTPRAQ